MERSLIKARKATVLLELTTNYEMQMYVHDVKESGKIADKKYRDLVCTCEILKQKLCNHENSKLSDEIKLLRVALARKEAESQKYKELTQINAQLEDKLKLSYEVIAKRDALQQQLVLANMDLELAEQAKKQLEEKVKELNDEAQDWKRKFFKLEREWQPLAIQIFECKQDNENHCKAIALQIEQHNIFKDEYDLLKCKNDDLATHNLRLCKENTDLRSEMNKNCMDLMMRNTELVSKLKQAENTIEEVKEQDRRITWLQNINRTLTEIGVNAAAEIRALRDENKNLINHISGEIS